MLMVITQGSQSDAVRNYLLDEGHDPAVLAIVMQQLEEQRDNIYAFSKSELNNEPPEIIERLREAKESHEAQIETLKKELIEANARARAGGRGVRGIRNSNLLILLKFAAPPPPGRRRARPRRGRPWVRANGVAGIERKKENGESLTTF